MDGIDSSLVSWRVWSTQLGLSKQLFSNTGTKMPRQEEKKNNLNSSRLSFAVFPGHRLSVPARLHRQAQTTTQLHDHSHCVVATPKHNTAKPSVCKLLLFTLASGRLLNPTSPRRGEMSARCEMS